MLDRVEDFLHYLSAERGSSKNTIDAYRNDLNGFARFAVERRAAGIANGANGTGQTNSNGNGSGNGDVAGAAVEAKSIDRQLVVDYLADLNRREYAKATVARKVAAVKSFCAFLLDGGDLTTNPTAQIDSPRAPKPVPKPMSTSEMDSLLKEPLKHDTPEAVRDAAMLELMYATGMRVTELVSLNLDSLYIKEEAHVRCVGKGAKERVIPVHANAARALERYLDQARPALLKSRTQSALFVNRRGERLTRQGFWLILKNYAKSAAIKTHVTPHTIRHSFATHLLRGGASVRDVQELLGHANVSTTQVYTQLADQHLREVYESVHPRAR